MDADGCNANPLGLKPAAPSSCGAVIVMVMVMALFALRRAALDQAYHLRGAAGGTAGESKESLPSSVSCPARVEEGGAGRSSLNNLRRKESSPSSLRDRSA